MYRSNTGGEIMEHSKLKFNLIILCIKSSKLSEKAKKILIDYIDEIERFIR